MKTKVALVVPPKIKGKNLPAPDNVYKEEDISIGLLISLLRNKGYDALYIDCPLDNLNIYQTIEEIKKYKPDLIGLSIKFLSSNLIGGIILPKYLRQNGINVPIVAGGHTATLIYKDILREAPEIDCIVLGEGENTLLDILEKNKTELSWEEIPGIAFNVNGNIKKNSPRPLIEDLDSLPFPARDKFKNSISYKCKSATMVTSRGCPFDCAFCSVDSVWGKQYTFFSVDRVIDEIKHLMENYGAKGVYFREDNFTLNRKRVEEFCSKIKKVGIKWACETRVDTLNDEELVKTLSKSGCQAVYLGVESGSQRVLDKLKKHITVEQIERCVNLCKKHNIRTYCSLITGVPGETYEDYLETKNLMKKLKPYSYNFSVFVGIPYSELYREVIENKLYEHIDDIGLVYLPGFDVKTKYFYGKDSKHFVDFEFKKRTQFDEKLLEEMDRNKIKKVIKRTRSIVPDSVATKMKKQKKLKNFYKRIIRK